MGGFPSMSDSWMGLQQHQRQAHREQHAHDDHGHEAHAPEGLARREPPITTPSTKKRSQGMARVAVMR